jgi:hypothetical protein
MFRQNPFILSVSFILKTMKSLLRQMYKEWGLGAKTTALPSTCQPGWQVHRNSFPRLYLWDWGATQRWASHAGTFYGHQGSNDNITYESMCKAGEQHGVEQHVVQCVCAMFGRLQIITAQMGRRLRVSVDKVSAGWGFVPTTVEPDSWRAHCMPQQKGSVHVDHLAMMTSGKFPRTVSEYIQRDLNIVQCWYRAKELSVIPNKMELILFTEREKVDEFMEPFSTKQRHLPLVNNVHGSYHGCYGDSEWASETKD